MQDGVKDYRVTIKVRNNRILQAIEESGGSFGVKWCEENGLVYSSVMLLVDMLVCPVSSTGRLRRAAQGLCDVLCKLPEDLWTEDQMFAHLDGNTATLEIDRSAIAALLAADPTRVAELDNTVLEQTELRDGLEKAMETLRPRERQVLALIYQQDCTLGEVGAHLGVGEQRAAQIHAAALRRMRYPNRAYLFADTPRSAICK